jgi:hypothetical protein
LNDFVEEGRSILYWLCEDLEKISFFIIVQQYFILLQNIDVL